MSALQVETAKAESYIKDTYVKQVSDIVKDDPDTLAAAEIVLLELALAELDINMDAIKRDYKAYRKKHIKKYYRALAKTVLSKHEGGEDGDDPHPSGSPQSVHSGKDDDKPQRKTKAQRDRERAEEERRDRAAESLADQRRKAMKEKYRDAQKEHIKQKAFWTAYTADSLAEGLIDTTERITEPAVAFLKESTLTKGAMAVVDYFANKVSTVQYFAKAVYQFGPIVGMRMLNAYFRYGGYDVKLKENAQGKRVNEFGEVIQDGESSDKTRSWAIESLRKRLSSRSAYDSQAEPPSEGYIIDKDGNIIAHGVGRGNDHYLPFSSRHLKKLRKSEGGEFVRRRLVGGVTVEDLHAAMMMGADRVTVVSNSGTFTVDLKGRSHGLRMEHMQILSRYQDLIGGTKKKGDDYERALNTLQDEFPLHFSTKSERGGWWDQADYVSAKTKLRDEFRGLFKVLAGEEVQDANTRRDPTTGGTIRAPEAMTRVRELGITGAYSNETIREYVARRGKQGTGQRLEALRHVGRSMQRETGRTPVWLDEEIRAAQRAMEEERRPKTSDVKVAQPGQKVQTVRPDNLPDDYTSGAERKRAKETPSEWKTGEYQAGYQRLKARGLPADEMGDDPNVEALFKTVSKLDKNQWKYAQQNPEDFHLGTEDWGAIATELDVLSSIKGL